MRCHEARTLIGPYLDSELDARTTHEIEQHLENCDDCKRVFEAEEKVDSRIFTVLQEGERTPSIWSDVETRLKPRGALLWLKRTWPLAVAATVMLAIGFALWSNAHKVDLAAAVEHCHEAYVRNVTSPEFSGAVPEDIAGRLGDRLDIAAFAYRPSSAGFQAEGARLCHVGNVPAALILGRYGQVPVSLVVLKRSELAHFPKLKQLFSKHAVVCSRSGRYQFAARVVDGHVVCIIGDAPRPSLEDILRTVKHSSLGHG